MSRKRVLIVDEQELLRRGLRDLLRSALRGITVGEAATADEAIERVGRGRWDLVLLDVPLSRRGGLTLLEEVRRLRPDVPVLVLNDSYDQRHAARVLRLGAAGYMAKRDGAQEIVHAVRRALAGEQRITSAALGEQLARRARSAASEPSYAALSQRELQILRLVALGRPLKDIAARLTLSEKTVATYRARIARKTGLRTGVEIARYALKHGLVE